MALEQTLAGVSPVMQDILDWSTNQPMWRRDALRQLVVHGEVTDERLDALVLGCLADAKALADDESAPKLEPLAAKHVPTVSVSNNDVSIRSVSNVENANALAPKQQLSLSPNGLSIVYGDNGSGKSGYARILKHASRARHKDAEIRSDVFAASPGKRASATIQCEIGSSAKEVGWQDGTQPTELSSVSCFDSDCAAVHVSNSNSIDFTPFGLDLFSKLADVCRRVKERIEQRITANKQGQSNAARQHGCSESSTVGRFLAGLTDRTNPTAVTEACHQEEDHQQRTDELEILLKTDPESEAKRFDGQATRLDNLARQIDQVAASLGPGPVDQFQQLCADAQTKRQAAELFAKELTGNTPLSGVGSNPWKQLWSSAKRYAELATPDHPHPHVGDDAVCVLCQQELGDEAKQRLKSFDEFVRNESETAAATAEQKQESARRSVQNIRLEVDHWQAAVGDLLDHNEDIRQLLDSELAAARQLRSLLLAPKDDEAPTGLCFESAEQIRQHVDTVRTRAKELRHSAKPEERKKLQQALTELKDRTWLSQHVDDFVEEITRLAELTRLQQANKATSTTAISTQGGKLAKKYVTEKLTKTFAEEVRGLCGREIKVSLGKGKSQQGVPTYQISLNSEQDAKPQQVLSEGELRCVAIAGFLTELATSENYSAIVLDDPVDSLGHEWRSEIARRLVEEAKVRQVIVFSHDMFFVEELKRLGRDRISVHLSHVKRSATKIGLCGSDLPWFGAGTFKRIKTLRRRLEDCRSDYDTSSWEAKIGTAENFFGDLRETIERTVEREFFSHTVKRFENYIPVGQLWKASVFSESDADDLHRLYRECSCGLKGHDAAPTGRPSAPAIDDMIKMLDNLKKLIEKVHQKRDAAEQRRRQTRSRNQRSKYEPSF